MSCIFILEKWKLRLRLRLIVHQQNGILNEKDWTIDKQWIGWLSKALYLVKEASLKVYLDHDTIFITFSKQQNHNDRR